jgi:hypothetical protein
MKKKVIFKYNEDDLLELMTEYLAKKNGFEEFQARALILGEPGKELRIVTVIADSEDNSIKDVDLNSIDVHFEYNGSHSKVRNINPSTFAKLKIEDC